MAISQSTLRNKAANYPIFEQREKIAANEQNFSNIRTAFLCHSHKDRELAKGLKIILKEQGVALYIDWEDESMPDKPNYETADKIRDKIRKANAFLFLATANSKASRWCPWELGYADGKERRIYIVPTEASGNYYGNEYLDLYPRIDEGHNRKTRKSGYAVFNPNRDQGMWVEDKL